MRTNPNIDETLSDPLIDVDARSDSLLDVDARSDSLIDVTLGLIH